MYFIKSNEANGGMPKSFYKCNVFNNKGQYTGFFVLGIKGSRAFLVRFYLGQHTKFELNKVLRFAKRWARYRDCKVLRIQLILTEKELQGDVLSCKKAMVDYAVKQGYKDSYGWTEYVTLYKNDILASSWSKKQLKTLGKGLVLPEGYRSLRFSQLSQEECQELLIIRRQHFSHFVPFDLSKKFTPEYSFAVFKEDVFVAYIIFEICDENTGRINGIAVHDQYKGAGIIALKCFFHSIYTELPDMIYFRAIYTRECVDGKRMLAAVLGGKYREYRYLRGHDKKL